MILILYTNSRKRSHLLELLLLGFAILDSFGLATLWTVLTDHGFAPISTAIVAIQTTATVLYAVSGFVISCLSGASPQSDTMANGCALFPSRETEVNFASLMFLGWLGPLLSAGKRGDILQSDLERIETHPTSAFFPSPDAQPKKDEDYSFMRQMARDTSLRTYLLFVLAVILAALTAATTLCQPIIIGALVAFLQTESHISVGSWLVVALFIE